MQEKKSVKYAAKMNWQEVKKSFDSGDLVLIPLGASCKEHGLHLPMNTDQIQAEYFAAKLAEKRSMIIMPTITDSYFPAFLDYAGSTSLSEELSAELVSTKCEQWHTQGARAFFILNFGISTNKPLSRAKKMLQDKGIQMHFSDLTAFDESIKEVCEQEGGTHADEAETSIMLFVKPDVVHMELAQLDFDNSPGKLTLNLDDAKNSKAAYSPTGAWGDPTLATPKKGKLIVDKLLDFLEEDILQFERRRVEQNISPM